MSTINFNVNNHCTYSVTKVVHERDVINRQVNTDVKIQKHVYETNNIEQEQNNTVHQRIDVYV